MTYLSALLFHSHEARARAPHTNTWCSITKTTYFCLICPLRWSALVDEWDLIRLLETRRVQIWYASQEKYNCYVICGQKRVNFFHHA